MPVLSSMKTSFLKVIIYQKKVINFVHCLKGRDLYILIKVPETEYWLLQFLLKLIIVYSHQEGSCYLYILLPLLSNSVVDLSPYHNPKTLQITLKKLEVVSLKS